MQNEIKEIVDRETEAWDTQDVEKLLSIFHPDMVWVLPKTNQNHHPLDWVTVLGKFNHQRWHDFYSRFFQNFKLIHNKRKILKVELSKEKDGAFAVVEIDTLWENKETKEPMHWQGVVTKAYAKVNGEWKMTMHTGTLIYDNE